MDALPDNARRRNAWIPAVLVLSACAYVGVAMWINGGTIFRRSLFDYYSLLADAVAHGRLWLEGSLRTDDLAVYQGRVYMYWGVSPLAAVAVFHAIGHGFQLDVAYTVLLGVANIALFAWMVREAGRALQVDLPPVTRAVVVLLFAFASPNFYLSMQGRIWHTNQIIATGYFLAFLGFFFRFVHRGRTLDFVIGAVFFHAAWVARMTYGVAGLLLLYPLQSWTRNRSQALVCLAAAAGLGLAAVAGWAAYNYVRFAQLTETGYSYMAHSTRFVAGVRSRALWSTEYLPHNVHYYVFNLPIDWVTGRFKLDLEGNSVLCFYPWTALVPGLTVAWRRVAGQQRPLVWCLSVVSAIQVAALLTFYATGWTQVGARYFLDATPILFVLLLPVLSRVPTAALLALATGGAALNLAGMLDFYAIPLR
ncbi:MAG: hypothetical protein R6V57_01630 [Vicinamibacterales bacterium]